MATITKILFEKTAFQEFNEWLFLDKKLHRKIIELLEDTMRQPYEGLGKPEPLKYQLSGFWSRRINQEHRLIYKVEHDTIIVVSCRYHYTES